MKKQNLFVLFFLLTLPFWALSQRTDTEVEKDASTFFSLEKYPEALENYIYLSRKKTKDNELKLRVGFCYYYNHQLAEAKRYFDFVFNEDAKKNPEVFLGLAKVAQEEMRFSDAILNYKKYLKEVKLSDNQRKSIKDQIRRCAIGLNLANKDQVALVENLGEAVNSSGDDFAPIQSPNYDDKLYFSSSRPENLGGLRNKEGVKDEKFGTWSSDMYSTTVVNGEWTATRQMSYLLNSPRYDIALGFSKDGKVLYYYKGFNLFAGETLVDTFKVTDEKPLYSDLFESPMESLKGDGSPCFFNDTLMVFASRRVGGFGGSDLYYSVHRNEGWTTPQNLGANINSPYDEITPFLARDGRTLYFSSNNTNGIGGFDVFKSRFNDEARGWALPENVGLPINSGSDDTHFTLTKDGLKAYFCSNRKTSGMGLRDIYSAYYRNALKEQATESKSDFAMVLWLNKDNLISENNASTASVIPITAPTDANIPTSEYKTFVFKSLSYEKDEDIVGQENIRQINQVIAFLKAYPKANLQLLSHSDESSATEFDLYFSLKRAEKVAEYMFKSGVNKQQLQILGCGSSYPIALTAIDGNPYPPGRKLNKRLDFTFFNIENLPINLRTDVPAVNENVASREYEFFQTAIKGLSYRVQIATIKQMYSGGVIKMYPDVLVESLGDSNIYYYTIGVLGSFSEAQSLMQNIQKQGVKDVKIIPYLDGRRISENDMEKISLVHSDLKDYLAKNKK